MVSSVVLFSLVSNTHYHPTLHIKIFIEENQSLIFFKDIGQINSLNSINSKQENKFNALTLNSSSSSDIFRSKARFSFNENETYIKDNKITAKIP